MAHNALGDGHNGYAASENLDLDLDIDMSPDAMPYSSMPGLIDSVRATIFDEPVDEDAPHSNQDAFANEPHPSLIDSNILSLAMFLASNTLTRKE